MRLVCTLNDQNKAHALSAYLLHQGIDNQLELNTNVDWGSHEYGNVSSRIWIVDEDQFDNAQKITEQFLENPNDSRFYPGPINLPTEMEQSVSVDTTQAVRLKQPLGRVTRILLIVCTILLVYGSFTEPVITTLPPPNIPSTPIFSPPINKSFMYDYPKAYELTDHLVKAYGLEALQSPDTLPKEGNHLLQQVYKTPYWEGFYPKFVEHYKNPDASWNFNAPMFEKIKEGEIWRLFTPALLHSDIFHLFFNMIWLIVLGRQMEQRLGRTRYMLFILITGCITNTAQYLMSGSNFLGFSGILCAMLTFIWIRQKRAAWEGYQLEKGTMAFITFFILFMFLLQTVSFFLEAQSNINLGVGIANTAHLVGAFIGLILAHSNFFSWQER